MGATVNRSLSFTVKSALFRCLFFLTLVLWSGDGATAVVKMRAWSTQLSNERLERELLADQEMADYWAYLERVREQADDREGGARRWRRVMKSSYCNGLSGRPEIFAGGNTLACWQAEALALLVYS